jgi:N-acetyl-D-muramate 6-phosphate phosphatase
MSAGRGSAAGVAETIAPVVLFDLDGTLVDSAADLGNAVNAILQREGRPALPLSAIRPVVSKGARAMLGIAFPERDAAAREALVQPFLDAYEASVAIHSTPFDGIEAVLAAIEAAGSRWGIVTNKPYYLAKQVVATMRWSERSHVLIGGDTLPRKKPDPDQLFLACEALGVPPGECIYVGDDERDIVAARRAGMKSVAVLWGYREAHEDPRDWRPDALIDTPTGLLAPGVLVR